MRLALLYSDGSMGILPAETSVERAWEHAADADRNEHNPAHFTKVARVSVQIEEALCPPAREVTCPTCGAPGAKP